MDPVTMQEHAFATASSDPFAQDFEDAVEFFARKIAERPGGTAKLVEVVFIPILRRDFRDDVLGQDIERRLRDLDTVETSLSDGAQDRKAFHEFITGQRKEPSFRH